MFRRYATPLIAVMMLLSAVGPSVALAATTSSGMVAIVPCGGAQTDNNGLPPCTVCSIAQLAQNILNDAIFVGVFLSAILFAYAGLKMLSTPTSPGQHQKATALFRNVVIGFVIIMAAWLIVNAIMSVLFTGGVGSLPWYKIC
ncbi:MAG TPA: hypothetical protein VN495_04135 [Candidatus Paceibacterota bacterium]|nr:hypothetical protein [Candidatus Paceibacterota bacterium]